MRKNSLPDPPIVVELENLLWWLGDGMNIIELAEQMQYLMGIITVTGPKLKKVVAETREHGPTPEAEKMINEYLSYLKAADQLTEVLSAPG